jgi:hypothetical protein
VGMDRLLHLRWERCRETYLSATTQADPLNLLIPASITRVRNQRRRTHPSVGLCDTQGMAHLLGYARISTGDQHPDLQVDALKAAGSYRVFADTASGALAARPALDQVFDQLRPGDEGFGSLDDLGRQGMIDELHTLASQLDRVIVVSHQADFSDTAYFPNGYSLRKAGRHTEVSRLIA